MALFIASDAEDLGEFVNKATERIEDAQRCLASILSEEVPKYLADDLHLVLATLDNVWEALGDCHEAVGIAKEGFLGPPTSALSDLLRTSVPTNMSKN